MERKTRAVSDSEDGPTRNIAGFCESLEQECFIENSEQSSAKATPSPSHRKPVQPEIFALNEIGNWLSRQEESSAGARCLTPVPDDLGDAFDAAGEGCAIKSVSSKATDQNSEPLQAERSTTPIPEPEDSWLDDTDLLSCLENVDNEMTEKKEKKELSHHIQGMIGMSLNVMRDYYSIGPEATLQKACYAPFYGYLNKENHHDEVSDEEEFRFDKKAYLKRFVHQEALVPEQPEYTGRRVLDEAVLWPHDPGSDVPHEESILESTTSPLDFLCGFGDVVPANFDKLSLPSKTKTEPASQLKSQVPLFPPPGEMRAQPIQNLKINAKPERFNEEVQPQAYAPPEMMFTFTAKPALQQQKRRVLGPSQQNQRILGPVQLSRSIPGPRQHNANIPEPSQQDRNIPGPIHGNPHPMDLRDKLRVNAGRLLRVTSTMPEQSQFPSIKPVNHLKVKRVPVFPPPDETRDQPVQDRTACHAKSQRFSEDIEFKAEVHGPQQQNRNVPGPSHTSYTNPSDLRGEINAKMALRNASTFQEKSPIPSHSTLLSDTDSTDSSDDEGSLHRRRFMRTVVSTSRRMLFSLSKGLMPQDGLVYAEPLKPEPTPKPPVELEKERIFDEWGEELDYELGSDDEEELDHTSHGLHIMSSNLQEDSIPFGGRSSAQEGDRHEPLKLEPAPKPSVELEKERIVDEWEELDYELGSDDEGGLGRTSADIDFSNSQLHDGDRHGVLVEFLPHLDEELSEESPSLNTIDEPGDAASISDHLAEVHKLAETFGSQRI